MYNHLMKMAEVSEFTPNYCDFNFYHTVDTW